MYRIFMLVMMGLSIAGAAFAAEVEEPAVIMGEVVVTATRQSEELSRVPANVTVVTEEEIARSPALTVPELLRSVPGVLVNDITGNGRNYTIDLRGFGETASLNTLVLVDGRRINQADLSGTDWVLIPKERVERIEIVRGSRGSVLYGDNATGGVVNIITQKGAGEMTGAVGVSGGSYETFQGHSSASTGVDKLSVAVDANYRTSDGYRNNSDTESKDAGLNFGYEVSERLSLRFSGGYHEDETGQPAALYKSALDSGLSRTSTRTPDDRVETDDWYLQGGVQLFLTDNSYLDVDASTRNRESDFSYISLGSTGKTEIDTVAFSPRLVLTEKIFTLDSKVLLGFDYQKDEEDIYSDSSYYGINSQDASKDSKGYYAHADVALNEKLSLSGGLRYEEAKFKFNDGGESYAKTIDEDLFTLGVNYQFTDTVSSYVSYAKSFRSPVLDEFYDFFENSFDPSLDAQTSHDVEVGLRLKRKSGAAFGVNLFHVETEDEIFYDPTGGPYGWGGNANLDGDSLRQGIELSFSKIVCDILLSGGYTYMDTEIDGGQYDGKEIPNVPEHQLTLGLQKTFNDRIQLGLNGTYVGERRYISDFDNDRGYMDDYFRLDGNLSYLLDKGRVYLAVNNILDEEYSEYGVDYGFGFDALYPSPELNFLVGVDFRF